MVYKASLDKLARIMTISVFILFAIICCLAVRAVVKAPGDYVTLYFNVISVVFFMAIIISSYLFAPKSYSVDKTKLTINRLGGQKIIMLADISQAVAVDDAEMDNSMRTIGVGGLFGYNGKYRLPKIGKIILCGTQRKNGILIVTKDGNRMVITPDDISLIDKLPH